MFMLASGKNVFSALYPFHSFFAILFLQTKRKPESLPAFFLSFT